MTNLRPGLGSCTPNWGTNHDRAVRDRLLRLDLAVWPGAFGAATLTAHLSIGNTKDSIGAAKIWNQLNVQVRGYKHLTINFTPGMMDFTKPLRLRVNSNEVESKKMIEPNLDTSKPAPRGTSEP